MLTVDYIIGPKAEFLNAFSVLERLLGKITTSGPSQVFQRVGAFGELIAVILANLIIGLFLAFCFRKIIF